MSKIIFEKHANIALVKLNDPEYHNAFSADMADGLFQALTEIEEDPSLRCLVLTGEGKSFCSGGKVEIPDPDNPYQIGHGFLRKYALPVLHSMKNLSVPIVTAINGPCVGFGVGFSLMNDLAYAADSMFFRMAFSKIGIVPDGGATWILPRVIGPKRTAQLAMLDDKLPAQKALEWGMVNDIFAKDQLLEKTLEVAEKLAAGPMSLGLMRNAIWHTWENSFDSQIELEVALMRTANRSEDHEEGKNAFMEKRAPVFTGK